MSAEGVGAGSLGPSVVPLETRPAGALPSLEPRPEVGDAATPEEGTPALGIRRRGIARPRDLGAPTAPRGRDPGGRECPDGRCHLSLLLPDSVSDLLAGWL